MEFLLPGIIVVLAVLLYFLRNEISLFFQQGEGLSPYKRKDFFLNIPERRFFEWLQKIIPSEYVVFPQILLSTVIEVNSSKKDFWTYQNKINRKTVDFVIFEKCYLKPVFAIEYDGKTHNRGDRKRRDEFVQKVLDSAGIESLHVKHQRDINFEELKNKINEHLISLLEKRAEE